MKVALLLTIFLVNTVYPIGPDGSMYVAQGQAVGNLDLAQGTEISEANLNGLALNANGLLLNQEGLALGNGGNERIVSNQRLAIQPRYITERVNMKPKVITETVVTPVYENTINQPRIERTRVELSPSFQKQNDIVRNNKRVEDVQNTEATKYQNVDVAADILEMRPVTRPALLIRKENVKFVNSAAENHNEEPVTAPTRQTGSTVQRSAPSPGDITNNRLLIQPIFEKTNLNVQLQRAADRVFNHEPTTLPLEARQRTRVELINVAGDQLYNQKVVRPAVTTEQVDVRFVPSQPVSETRDALIRPTIRNKEVRNKFYNLEYKVPVEKTVRVRVPNYIKVNDYRTVHVPVDENGNEINVSQGGYNVLGGAGLDNQALSRVQGAWNLAGGKLLQGAGAEDEFNTAYRGMNITGGEVLSATDTLAQAAESNGHSEFAAGLEAGAELLNAAMAQNTQVLGSQYLIGSRA